MKILFVLQNSYHSEKYNYRNLEEWYEDLGRSYSGKRLKEMIPNNCDIAVINSTLEIGDDASSYFQADLVYLTKKINEIMPDYICACGKVAQEGLRKLGKEFISAPHPAWRALSKKTTADIQAQLQAQLQEPLFV